MAPMENSPPDAPAPTGNQDASPDRNMAILIHVLAIFTGFLAPLIIWLLKKDQSPFIDHHGKQALNFQITVLIAMLVASALLIVFIGCVLMPAIWIVDIIFCIMAAMAASKGEMYRYPLAIQFLK